MKRYKIGYTTGVFDLFHVGHLNILRRAKEQCDYLIVGVSTDELVMEYKQREPVIPFEERKAIVEGIKHVDRVVPQINRDKFAAWEHLLFNVMFVGDDWKGDVFFNELEGKFAEVGVEIVYFPYTKGVSSTIVKEKCIHKGGGRVNLSERQLLNSFP
ncbi:adenylyltransferase/cytidyltransferase family protein [Virgibacillus oceani]